MRSLADLIEDHIKQLLAMAGGGVVEVRRRELADRFACVPSQINYVLSTRFTPAQGYVVETRRGGAGYVRIERIRWRKPDIARAVYGTERDRLTEQEADRLLDLLETGGILSARRARLIRRAMRQEVERLDPTWRAVGRAMFLKGCLLLALHEDGVREDGTPGRP